MNNLRIVLLCTALAAPEAALAQTSPTDAQPLFRRGVAALHQSRFAEAVEALEASVALRPSPPAVYNLGFAYVGLGRHRDAIAQFERWLDQPSRGATPATLATVRAEIARLRSTLITVTVTPSDATLTINGRAEPLRDGRAIVDPGRRVIEVTRTGFTTERRDVAVDPGGRVDVTLRELPPPIAPITEPGTPVVAPVAMRVAARAAPTPHPPEPRPPEQRATWRLPVLIAGGVVVLAAGITTAVLLTQDELVVPSPGTWGQLSTR